MSSVPLQVQFDPSSARFGTSRSQKRLEDERLLIGKGRYSDDLDFPNQCWLVVARSPYAHARIRSIDLTAVKSAPGVIAAWTMADLRADGIGHIPFPPLFKRADGSPMAAPLRTPLADGTVHFLGQAVVAVVAQTRAQAQDAAEQASIDYEDLPCVVDAKAALAPGAGQRCGGGELWRCGRRERGDARRRARHRARASQPARHHHGARAARVH